MASAHLYQIFYSDETHRQLDPGFIPLDNSPPLARTDWREYWPMRNFLLNQPMVEQDYYGFFSPKFHQKTRLTAEQAKAFIVQPPSDADIVVFSPMWDMAAFFLNPFEQGEMFHPGMFKIAVDFYQRIRPDIHVGQIMTDSRNTVYCNYFAARPVFWRRWLEVGEQLFSLAESGEGELARQLISRAVILDESLEQKVFIMERIVTFILATEPRWKIKMHDPYSFAATQTGLAKFRHEAIVNDALKIASAVQKYPEYRDAFLFARKQVVTNFLD